MYGLLEFHHGQLGLGDNINRNVPTQILIWPNNEKMAQKLLIVIFGPFPVIIKQNYSCGAYQTIIIDLFNNVWSLR